VSVITVRSVVSMRRSAIPPCLAGFLRILGYYAK
jgi:hypothetical protein